MPVRTSSMTVGCSNRQQSVKSICARCSAPQREKHGARQAGGGGGQGRHLKIQENAARDVLSGTGLGEERVERIVTATDRLVGGHLSIGLDAVLQAIQLPAGVADLRTSRLTIIRTRQSLNRRGRGSIPAGRLRIEDRAESWLRSDPAPQTGRPSQVWEGYGSGVSSIAAASSNAEAPGRGGSGRAAQFKVNQPQA